MKHRFASILFVFSVLLGTLLPSVPALAAGASISLTANHTLLSNGSTLIVAVYMNGGGNPINAVEADLNYPASKLQYVGLSYSGSAFSINTPSNGGGGGAVSIQNGTVSPVSGSGLVATVTFRALVGSGSAAIGVSGSSNLINANDNSSVPYGSSGVTVNFGAPVAASSTASATPTPAPAPKDTTPPVISALKVKDITPFSATITWTTNEPADSAVDFGLDTTYGLSTSSSTATTTHSVALNSAFLTPETLLHYRVKSTDGAGNVATGTDQSFQLPGVSVVIVVRGADGKPQPGATVTLDGSTGTTDAHGQVTLPTGLGNKKITTNYQGVTIEKPITIGRSTKPLPPYQLDLSKQPINPWMLTSIGLIIVVLTLLGIDAVLFGSQFLARLTRLHATAPAWHMPTIRMPHITFERPARPVEPSPSVSTVPKPTDAPVDDGRPVDVTRSVAELMGDPAMPAKTEAVSSPAVPKPISHFGPTTQESMVPQSSQPEKAYTSSGLPPSAPPVAAAPVSTRIAVTDAVETPSAAPQPELKASTPKATAEPKRTTTTTRRKVSNRTKTPAKRTKRTAS